MAVKALKERGCILNKPTLRIDSLLLKKMNSTDSLNSRVRLSRYTDDVKALQLVTF